MVATEPRLKLAIFLVGGFYFQHARPEVEAINFAPRVRVPTLMLNGRYDFFYPVDASQSFMLGLIGVPEPQKRWMVYPTSHNLPRENMVDETLRWLDQSFGRVATRKRAESQSFEGRSRRSATIRFMLVVSGIHLLENLKLDELASKRVYEFAFVVQPLKMQGFTGSTVAPVAIR